MQLIQSWTDATKIDGTHTKALSTLLTKMLPSIDEANATEEKRYDRLVEAIGVVDKRTGTLKSLSERLSVCGV